MELKAPNIQMLNDSGGKTSAMRILVIYIVVVYMGVWAVLSVKEGAMYEIDWEQSIVIIGALMSKAYQSGRE